MTYSLVHFAVRLLPLLAVLVVSPSAQADRDHRRHDHRLQPHYQPYGHYREHRRHYRTERRHKAYRHYRKHKHNRPRQRVRVIERYHYSAPHHYRVPSRPGVTIVLPLGSLIRELPGGYISLYFNGQPFYYQGGNYYRPHRHGYRVVAPPGRSAGW
ncbi:DUF6515 family protein [Oceanimonas sp. MB9]|uniref:DUF6515 family protein n=1 Tax=Oceanimonas sp. MB9 TaxID=2588453 RepID=UPI0013F5D90C|nr:DUF6515 family protein [Oceanimonas sp. MB9]NHI00099.1 hypothetical protein [Oceanimonas sp. MB9]